MDALGVALAHQEQDGGGVGRAVGGQALLPIQGQEPPFLGQGIDVIGQGQGHHIGLEAFQHGPGLFAAASMGLVDGHLLARAGLPGSGEGPVEGLVELPGGIVGHVEEGGRTGREGRARHQQQPAKGERSQGGQGLDHVAFLGNGVTQRLSGSSTRPAATVAWVVSSMRMKEPPLGTRTCGSGAMGCWRRRLTVAMSFIFSSRAGRCSWV